MNKKNILICTPFSGTGGISTWSKHIKTFYSLNFSTFNVDFFELDRCKQSNVGIKRLFIGIFDYLQLYFSYKKKIKDNPPALIHFVSSASLSLMKDLLFLNYAKKKKINTVIHFHFGRIPDILTNKNWEYKLLMKVIAKCDRVIVIDKLSYNSLLNHGINKVNLLPNPLADRTISIIKQIEIKREKNKIVFAGHMVETKGVFELIKACEKLTAKYNLSLSMNGLLKDDMKQKIALMFNNKIPSWLLLNGNQPYEKVIKEMLSAAVFVLPTYTEGFPNVILESMACGCSIVTTPVGAIPEMLDKDSKESLGIFVPVKDIDALEKAIEKMLNEEAFAIHCGEEARKKVFRSYTMDIVVAQMENIWRL